MNGCSLCPLNCNADRSNGKGACNADDKIKIAKYYLHPFEEPVISGKNGSGTVFFCGCSLKCVFCQNYEVSRNQRGKYVSEKELADIFRFLEDSGAANINLVSPTQYSDKILGALKLYKPKIPVCYNTHGYEKVEIIDLLTDFVDIFLPDMKYVSPERSLRYSGVKNYFEYAYPAIGKMISSKPCVLGADGLLKQGVIVRHLILPQNLDETKKVLTALKQIIGDAYLSLMSQYTPFGELKYPELKRKITLREYQTAVDFVRAQGFEKVFLQEFSSQGTEFIPKWDF